jgi:hypothetical protein
MAEGRGSGFRSYLLAAGRGRRAAEVGRAAAVVAAVPITCQHALDADAHVAAACFLVAGVLALLRFGETRRPLVGLVAGALGTVGGVAMAWLVTRFGFEMPWAWSPGLVLLAILSTAALSVAAGLAASARALAVRPLAVLRQVG